MGFAREELPQLQTGGETIGRNGILCAFAHRALQSAEAIAHIASLQIDGAEVGKLHVQIAIGCPATLLIIVFHAQLVHPHLAALAACRQIAHTDHNRSHLTQRRIAHDGH